MQDLKYKNLSNYSKEELVEFLEKLLKAYFTALEWKEIEDLFKQGVEKIEKSKLVSILEEKNIYGCLACLFLDRTVTYKSIEWTYGVLMPRFTSKPEIAENLIKQCFRE